MHLTDLKAQQCGLTPAAHARVLDCLQSHAAVRAVHLRPSAGWVLRCRIRFCARHVCDFLQPIPDTHCVHGCIHCSDECEVIELEPGLRVNANPDLVASIQSCTERLWPEHPDD